MNKQKKPRTDKKPKIFNNYIDECLDNYINKGFSYQDVVDNVLGEDITIFNNELKRLGIYPFIDLGEIILNEDGKSVRRNKMNNNFSNYDYNFKFKPHQDYEYANSKWVKGHMACFTEQINKPLHIDCIYGKNKFQIFIYNIILAIRFYRRKLNDKNSR